MKSFSPLLPTTIRVVFDTICPWCYIGKKRLDFLLASSPSTYSFELKWQALLLHPRLSRQGISYSRYVEHILGGAERVKYVHDNLTEAGDALGITFNFERIKILPHTVLSHALICLSKRSGCTESVIEDIFSSFLCEGRDIGDIKTLIAIGEKNGILPVETERFLNSPASRLAIEAESEASRIAGYRGVPSFAFNERAALVGAQEIEVFRAMLSIISPLTTAFPAKL